MRLDRSVAFKERIKFLISELRINIKPSKIKIESETDHFLPPSRGNYKHCNKEFLRIFKFPKLVNNCTWSIIYDR